MVQRHPVVRMLTCYYSCPPYWILEVGVIVTRVHVGGIPLGSIVKSLVGMREGFEENFGRTIAPFLL